MEWVYLVLWIDAFSKEKVFFLSVVSPCYSIESIQLLAPARGRSMCAFNRIHLFPSIPRKVS